jgi:hypothetical protein
MLAAVLGAPTRGDPKLNAASTLSVALPEGASPLTDAPDCVCCEQVQKAFANYCKEQLVPLPRSLRAPPASLVAPPRAQDSPARARSHATRMRPLLARPCAADGGLADGPLLLR